MMHTTLSIMTVLVLLLCAEGVSGQSLKLLEEHWDKAVVSADLPAGFSPTGQPIQSGWVIAGDFKSDEGMLRVQVEYVTDDHPLASLSGESKYRAELSERAKADGHELLRWGSFSSLGLTGQRSGSTQTARGFFINGRLEVTMELRLNAEGDRTLEVLRAFGKKLSLRLANSLEGGKYTRMDTYVGDMMTAAEIGEIAPEGFTQDGGTGWAFTGRSAFVVLKSDANKLSVRIEREPDTDEAKSAADRRAPWAESRNVLSGGDPLVVRGSLGRRRVAYIFQGPWTLSVSFEGAIRDKYINPDAEFTEESAVALLEAFAPAVWGRLFGAVAEEESPPEIDEEIDEEMEEAEEEGLSEREEMLLAHIADMDALLAAVEQPLQEALVQLQLVHRAQGALQTEMREISALAQSTKDPELKKKVQERITRNVAAIGEQGRELLRLQEDSLRTATEAEQTVRAIYESEDYGTLDDAARARLEMIVARVHMFPAQVALVTGDTKGAIRIAEAMRSNFRLVTHGRYIEGMALMQEGKTLDALAVFRNARRAGVGGAGAPFEALERETEIQVLGSLKRLAAETSSAFDKDFETWIASKAETNRPHDQTSFEWMFERFLKRPWYDTVGGVLGVGIAEADARGEEAGIVADDMAVTQVGLNFIIGLRRDQRLSEIRGLTTEQLRAAARERWGRDLSEDQLRRMRTAIRHAFELPDLVKLSDEESHIERSSFSGPLAAQVGLEDRWGRGAEVLAMGASTVNGWSVLTQFAPAAKLSVAGSMRYSAKATETFKDTVSLGEYFAASRPVAAVLSRMQQSTAGRTALQLATSVDDFAQQGKLERVTVMAAEMAVEGGAALVAQQYAGETGAMLVDVISATGATSPDFYGKAFRTMTREQVESVGRRLVTQAVRQRKQASTVSRLVSEVTEGSASDLEAFRRRVEGARLEPDIAERIAGYADVYGTGDPALVVQAQRDIERMAARQFRLADQSEAGARAVNRASAALDIEPAQPRAAGQGETPWDRPIGDPLAEPYPGTVDAGDLQKRPIGDPLADRYPGTVDAGDLQKRPIGDPLADPYPGTLDAGDLPDVPIGDRLALDEPNARGPNSGTADVDGSPPSSNTDGTFRGSGADEPIARAREGAASERPKFDLEDPKTPGHAGDVALSAGEFEAAAARYQDALTALPDSSPRRLAIREKLELARKAGEARAKIAVGEATVPQANPPILVDNPAGQRAVLDAVTGDDPNRWVSVLAEVGEDSASKPRFVKDANLRNIAVTKTASGQLGHPEGRAEHLASLLSERLGRSSPRARPLEVTSPGGEDLIVVEMMEQGVPLKKVAPDAAHLLARKDELAEDMVFSVLIGDGDRHLGNYWLTPDERLVPYDYGLADIVREHPYRNAKMVSEVRPIYDAAIGELEGLLALPNRTTVQTARIDRIRELLPSYEIRALYHDLATPLNVPSPGDPGFEAFVQKTTERHLEWGTRSWRDKPMFWDSVAYEDFEPHIRRIKQSLEAPGALDAIVDEAMRGHQDIEYTRELLKTRLNQLEQGFSRFPSRRRSPRRGQSVSHRPVARSNQRTPQAFRARRRSLLRLRRTVRRHA